LCYETTLRVRLHLVDGTFELYRAHYSKRPDHRAPDGRDLKATVGMVESLVQLLGEREEGTTHLAIAFDNPIRSFRNDLFAPYKSDEGVPPELRSQFDEAEKGAAALGVAVWSMKEFEADDGLASGAARFRSEVEQVRILSPDKDLGQCLRGDLVVQVNRITRAETNEAALRAKRGFGPKSIPDFLALQGDDADGIPGLPGFGEKTASRLLGHFEHLEAIPDAAADWPKDIRGAAGLAATLSAHRADALLYRTLATLREDVPLGESLEALRWKGPAADWDAWCQSVGARTLRARAQGVAAGR